MTDGRRRLPAAAAAGAGCHLCSSSGAVLVSVVVLLPLVFLIVQAAQVGWAQLHQLLFRSLTATLIWNSVSLVVVVTILSAIVGTLAAWFVERTDVPCRRLLAILVVIPLGIPDFVVSFGWKAIFPSIAGFWAAVLVMTLAVYPLVFLPVAASLRAADPAQEEVARSLGLGRIKTFWTVTVGQARLAIFGGAILVGLVVLAEFGAFEILGYQTLTTEIYNEFQVGFNEPAACALSLILVLLGGAAPGQRGHGARARSGSRVWAPVRLASSGLFPLGRLRPVAFGGLGLLVGLALGVPVGAIVSLLLQGGSSTLPAAASLPDATLNTFGYAAAAGCRRHAGGRSDRPPVGAFPEAQGAQPGAIEPRGPRRARPGDRVEPRLCDRALPAGPLLPDEPVAGGRLRHHVLSAGRGVGPCGRGTGPRRASRRWPARSG